jgi:PTS system galactitol-specific IIA component
MAEIAFTPDLVVVIDNATTYQEVESILAERLVQLGYAKDTYPQAIAERETNYPTGLDVEGINAAMPHCDIANVNNPAICVGVLKNPVAWRKMDDPDATCQVSLVTMLALTEAHAHIDMLTKVVALIQNQDLMKQIVGSDNADEIYKLIAGSLS